MTMKRVAIVLISFLVASIFAVVVSVTDPGAAQAAGGGYVEKCGGGEIFLNEKEEKINDEFREIGVGTATGDYEGFNGVTMYSVDFGVRRR